MANMGWIDIEDRVETRHITLPSKVTLDGSVHGIGLSGWPTVMINPPVPAGEDIEYDLVEMNAAVRAGESVTWERVGPNLCRLVRARPLNGAEQ